MDNYIEYMVKRRKSPLDYAYVLGILLAGLIVFYLSTYLILIPTVMLLLVVGTIYYAYKLTTRINMEYEYLIVNYEMDVEKIIGGRSRKKIDTINLKRIEDFGFLNGTDEKKYLNNSAYKKVYACADKQNGCAFIAYSAGNGKKLLFFTPNEEMVEYIKKVNPGKF